MALSDRVFGFLPKGQPSNILYDGLVAGLAAGERVACTDTDNYWYEIGSEADFLEATKQCLLHLFGDDEQGRFLEQLCYHYGRVLFPKKSQLIVGKDCIVDPSARIEGPCLLGNGVTIGPNVTIKNYAVIGDATSVAEDCLLDQVVLGRNLSISARTSLSHTMHLV
jgi:NDP-sugar pyrophosphorylase family protein